MAVMDDMTKIEVVSCFFEDRGKTSAKADKVGYKFNQKPLPETAAKFGSAAKSREPKAASFVSMV